jgi:carbamoyl-phosphate synthase large subunit
MADAAYLGKNLDDPGFIERLIEICQAEGCKYLFSGFDAELAVLSRRSPTLRAKGIIPIVSTPEVVRLGDSKAALANFLKSNGFPYIPTATNYRELYDLKGPYIVKPDAGCRSQGVEKFNTVAEIQRAEIDFEVHHKIAQEYIEGDEYTCGTVSFDGDVKGVIAMTRELRSGDTYKARVDQNPIVIEFVRDIISTIQPFGPCNVQLRLRDGVPYVLEINVRCSGTTAARTLAGFNEPEMVLNHLEGLPVEHNIEPIEILRYWDEIAVRPAGKERIHR